MWLTRCLTPNYKTIASFRRDNSKATSEFNDDLEFDQRYEDEVYD